MEYATLIAVYSLSHRQVGGLLRAIFHAEYAPLPRIIYFVGKWAISVAERAIHKIKHPFPYHIRNPSQLLGIIWYARIVGTLGMAVDRVHLLF